jgi:hypothetical protein
MLTGTVTVLILLVAKTAAAPGSAMIASGLIQSEW